MGELATTNHCKYYRRVCEQGMGRGRTEKGEEYLTWKPEKEEWLVPGLLERGVYLSFSEVA